MLYNPYVDIVQKELIHILPIHLNTNLIANIKNVLQSEYENKCNENGLIITIYNICEIEELSTPAEIYNGAVPILCTFYCNICIPIMDAEIICRVLQNISNAIIAKNGPLIILVQNNLDESEFTKEYISIKTGKQISDNDYIVVKIKDFKIHKKNSNNIRVIAELLRFANQSQIDGFINKSAKEIDNYYDE